MLYHSTYILFIDLFSCLISFDYRVKRRIFLTILVEIIRPNGHFNSTGRLAIKYPWPRTARQRHRSIQRRFCDKASYLSRKVAKRCAFFGQKAHPCGFRQSNDGLQRETERAYKGSKSRYIYLRCFQIWRRCKPGICRFCSSHDFRTPA